MDSHKWNKIRITGGSGSGKTYLASRISLLTGIPLTSMDDLTYDFSQTHRFSHKRSIPERQQLLAKVMSKNKWVLEGGYYSAVTHTYDSADIIIFLHPSFIRRLFNTFKRFFKRLFSGKCEGFRNFLKLTRDNFSSRRKWQVDRYIVFNKNYPSKCFTFKSADDAFKWFKKEYL